MKTLNILLLLGFITLVGCDKKPKEKIEERGIKQQENAIVELSAREQILVNLQIDTVKIKTIYETSTLLGKATLDENNTSIISSRVKGRVEKLFVRNTGEEIKAGQALYSIYSEELLSDENEFLLALEQKSKYSSQINTVNNLILASKKKLELWGMSEKQITELTQGKQPSLTITYYSKLSGYLAELNISEGEYVEEGTPIFKIAKSGSVWVEAQVYPYEIKYFQQNSEISIKFESYPNETFEGKIILNPPSFGQNSRISFVKIEIQNQNGKVKPGMMASVIIKRNEKKVLAIPKSAITLGEMPVVWIEKENGKYEMREIHIGIETKSEVEVLHGIKEGEKIVSSGAYLINSAYILKNGANSMGGMKM